MKTNRNLGIAAIAAIIITGCSAPKLSKYASQTDLSKKAKYDVSEVTIRDNGKGFTVDFDKMKTMPKRVALVSFYTEDPGFTKVTGTNMTGKNFTTTNTGEAGAKMYATYFYDASIENLKKSFSANGMQLLTPSEYLTSEDKRSFYNNFVVKHSKLNKIGAALTKFMKKAGNMGTSIECKAAANGFVLADLNKNVPIADAKKKAVKRNGGVGLFDNDMIECLGYDLCKQLDVDAVVIVVNTQLCDKRNRHYLAATGAYMFGPNPLPLAEGKKDNMFYSKGLFYSGYRMAFKKGLRIDAKAKTEEDKAKLETDNKLAYNNMIVSIANKIGGEITEAKKN